MTTTTTMPTLTRDDVRALRNADEAVVFFFESGKSYVRAAKKVDPNDGFGPRTLDREIVLPDAQIVVHRPAFAGPVTYAVASMGTVAFNKEWKTVAKLLREGDVLQMVFEANNDTTCLREADLARDTFTLIVRRELPSGRIDEMHFTLADEVMPRHSPARTIRSTE